MKIADINASQQQAIPKDQIRLSPHGALSNRKPNDQTEPARVENDPINLRTKTASYALRKFEAVNSVMNNAASSIRTADEAMQSIGAQIALMKSSLTEIMKQYPPFPPGSEERVAILKSFSALRRQIDALSFPPDDTGAQNILSAVGGDDRMPRKVDLGISRFEINVHRLPVNTGPDGLDIPDLTPDAGDEQVRKTLDHLNLAQKSLDSKRDLLTADAERITRMQ